MTPLKLLPCATAGCRDRGAMLPPSKANPEGEPHLASRCPGGPYKCHRCKRLQHIDVRDWARLPRLSYDDVERLAKKHRAPELVTRMRCDMEGMGLGRRGRHDEVKDLLDAGLTSEDVIRLARDFGESKVDESGTLDSQGGSNGTGPSRGGSKGDAAASGTPPE